MDLKELGMTLSETLALRGMIDSLDEKIISSTAQIELNKKEISRLEALQAVTNRMDTDKQALVEEKRNKNAELVKRLAILDEVGVKLPLQEKFGARQVSL